MSHCHRGNLRIVFASQTGTAQDGAEYIARHALRSLYSVRIEDIASLQVQDFMKENDAVIFVVSTTGDGEFPDRARAFWRQLLRRNLSTDTCAGLRFTVFGFGDTAYEKYNAAARKLWNRLLQLGASPFCARGLGDDSSPRGLGAEGDLDAWLQAVLWPSLAEAMPLPTGRSEIVGPMRLKPRHSIEMVTSEIEIEAIRCAETACAWPVPLALRAPDGAYEFSYSPGPSPLEAEAAALFSRHSLPVPVSRSSPLLARVVHNGRMTLDGWAQDVRHIRLKLPDGLHRECDVPPDVDVAGDRELPYWTSTLPWCAGDVAVVHPANPALEVARFAERLGFDLDACVKVSARVRERGDTETARALDQDRLDMPALGPYHILPPALSLRFLFTWYLDITGRVRRGALEQLSLYARDEEQAEKLLEMSGAAGTDIYTSYCVQERRTLCEILDDFDSIQGIPLDVLLELVPQLQPRQFSIASSPVGPGGTLDLCSAVVHYKTKRGRDKRGVCSAWLRDLSVGCILPVWIRPGAFRLPLLPPPSSPSATTYSSSLPPLILVGPGTGVAPMRSVLQELCGWWAAVMRHHGETALNEQGTQPPHVHLYFGCRHRAQDWLFGDEFRAMAGDSAGSAPVGGSVPPPYYASPSTSELDTSRRTVLKRYEVAFSRDPLPPQPAVLVGTAADDAPTIPQSVYVQSLLRRPVRAAELGRLLADNGARVFIAGSANKMPQDVIAALRDSAAAAVQAQEHVDASSLATYTTKWALAMERAGCLTVEAWS